MPRVLVVGGSLGGLTAASVLRDAGCDVRVVERSAAALDARGAGIAVLPETLRYPVQRLGLDADALSVRTDWIRFLATDGSVVHEQAHRYRFSSWNTIYRALLDGFDAARYRLGTTVTSFATVGDVVRVGYADGAGAEVDLLVCADGVTSAARRVLQPDVSARYAGYVAWRGTVPESQLSSATRARLGDALTYQQLERSHILAYPIPGPGSSVAAGQRLINMVWYRNVEEGSELADLLTDVDGVARSGSLPPGAARPEVVRELRAAAVATLAPPLAEVVGGIADPFVQCVVDIEVAAMVAGRACLLGDAAFAVRPHAAAGTAKAAEDGWVLAEELTRCDGRVPEALAGWQRRQLRLGRSLLARTRAIGDSSQFTGGFTAGDPRLIFGLHAPAALHAGERPGRMQG